MAAGHFAGAIDRLLDALPQAHVRYAAAGALQRHENVGSPAGMALYVGYRNGSDMAVYIDTHNVPAETDRSLLDIFCTSIPGN